jgi:putative membrane protein
MTVPRTETQPERTALAWQRTGLGVMAVAGLLGHGAVQTERPVMLGVAGGTALLGLAVLGGLAPVRYRQVRRRLSTDEPMAAPGLLITATIVVLLASVAAVVAVVMLAAGRS